MLLRYAKLYVCALIAYLQLCNCFQFRPLTLGQLKPIHSRQIFQRFQSVISAKQIAIGDIVVGEVENLASQLNVAHLKV